MKTRIYTTLSLLCGIMMISNLAAQRGTGYFVDNFYQSEVNPAYIPEDTFSIFVGNSLLDIANNGFTVGDVLSADGGSTSLTLSNLATGDIQNYNLAGIEATISTLDFGYKLRDNLVLSAGHAWRLQSGIGYNQDLINLISFGNANYIGQTLNLGPYIDYTAFNEFHLGAAVDLGKFKIGTKVKYLSGIENLSTGSNRLGFTTDEEIYQLTLDADYEIFNSRVLTYNGPDDTEIDTESYLSFNNLFTKNHGFAIDLGATLDLTENLTVFLSAIDLGTFTWDNTPNKYTLQKQSKLDGFDLIDIIKNEGEGFNIQDSLLAFLDADITREDYTTSLNGTLFFGAKVTFLDYTFGMMINSQAVANDRRTSISLVGKKKLSQYLTVAITNTIRDKIFVNPGLQIAARVGGLRAYFGTDNVISLVSPKSQNIFNMQGGVGYAF